MLARPGPHPLPGVTPLPDEEPATAPVRPPPPVARPSAAPSQHPVARAGLPRPRSKTPRTLAILGVGLLAVWLAPALGIGVFTAGRALGPAFTASEPQGADDATPSSITWDDIDRSEDRQRRLFPGLRVRRERPTEALPPPPPAPLSPTAPLTLTLSPGLFATTATARCPDGSSHRAPFTDGTAVLRGMPSNEVCRITLQGGGPQTTFQSGPGNLRCSLATTAARVLCI